MPEIWDNPMHSMEDRLKMAAGAVEFERKVVANLRQQLTEARAVSGQQAADVQGEPDDAAQRNGLAWAVSKWRDEVSQRPMANVHRRSLDDTWRQVIRYFGGDPDKLVGPSHDAIYAANGNKL